MCQHGFQLVYIYAPDDHLWAFLPKLYINKFGDAFYILKTTVTHNISFASLHTIPEFYKDVIFAYNKSKVFEYEDFRANLKTQPLWGNNFIKLKTKTLFFKSWVSEGISYRTSEISERKTRCRISAGYHERS